MSQVRYFGINKKVNRANKDFKRINRQFFKLERFAVNNSDKVEKLLYITHENKKSSYYKGVLCGSIIALAIVIIAIEVLK